jgi:hypothetical protein
MTETTVVVENEPPEETADSNSEILDAVDAHVSAGDAEDSADESLLSAQESEEAALTAWIAAESAWQAEQESANTAATMQAQLTELRVIADDLVTASSNQLQAAQLMRGQAQDSLPEPEGESEIEPGSNDTHWLRKKWW